MPHDRAEEGLRLHGLRESLNRKPQADRMSGIGTAARALGIASPGHAFFAATMVGLGILGLAQGNFPPTWTGAPKSVPPREPLAYLCALIPLSWGSGLLCQPSAAVPSPCLLAGSLVCLLLFRVP